MISDPMNGRPAAKIADIARDLELEYGVKTWRPGESVLSQLIKTILSQNTTDANSLRAFESLRKRFPTWTQVQRAPRNQVAAAIRSGGLAGMKAQRIKDILGQICRSGHGCDLSFLQRWPTARIRAYLARFNGVGEKTIACVLLFALGRPVMPVDTHVRRVSQRLGLIPRKTDANKAHALLGDIVPPDLVYAFHLNLIQHGREVCKARRPLCGRCPLVARCLAYQQQWPQIQ